jgi:hypothetical protein
MSEPAQRAVTTTSVSVPREIMERFRAAVPDATTYGVMTLRAVQEAAGELPELVVARRQRESGTEFPWRALGSRPRGQKPEPLRIRPYAGELAYFDALAAWVTGTLRSRGVLPTGRVSRSEVVATALDKHLPALKGKRK